MSISLKLLHWGSLWSCVRMGVFCSTSRPSSIKPATRRNATQLTCFKFFFYAIRQTHKPWRSLEGEGYNFFFRGCCHLLLGLKQGYPLYSPNGCRLGFINPLHQLFAFRCLSRFLQCFILSTALHWSIPRSFLTSRDSDFDLFQVMLWRQKAWRSYDTARTCRSAAATSTSTCQQHGRNRREITSLRLMWTHWDASTERTLRTLSLAPSTPTRP